MFYTGHVDMNFVAVSKMSINYVCVSEPNTDRVSSKVYSRHFRHFRSLRLRRFECQRGAGRVLLTYGQVLPLSRANCLIGTWLRDRFWPPLLNAERLQQPRIAPVKTRLPLTADKMPFELPKRPSACFDRRRYCSFGARYTTVSYNPIPVRVHALFMAFSFPKWPTGSNGDQVRPRGDCYSPRKQRCFRRRLDVRGNFAPKT